MAQAFVAARSGMEKALRRYDPPMKRRRCPRCGMLLWAKALPRRFRLHDTRHTTATLLLSAGVDLYAVARILRHTDSKVTFETYAHLVPGYLHAQIDRLPKLEPFAALVAARGS